VLHGVSISLGTKFAAMRRMFSSSDKIPWHVPYHSPTILQTSGIVLRSSRIASRTFATFSVVVPVEGRPERSSSSTDIRPFLKRLNHSRLALDLGHYHQTFR
jgi:hypothetical protein